MCSCAPNGNTCASPPRSIPPSTPCAPASATSSDSGVNAPRDPVDRTDRGCCSVAPARAAAVMKIYGDSNSGNCLKVKWVCDHLALPYTWIDVDTMKRETRTTPFLKLNPAGQVPTVEFDDGRTLAQSNAIIRYFARGSDLIPADAFAAAKMDEWLFWEQ